MRLHTIRLKNLNALMGEWAIDLTHPAIVNDGIFAIVGPTGSGKTTLLDAVCLALYGRTPRLPKVTKSGNDIMSRPAGDCFAEVVFSTQKGTYRCHWSHHRARRKADGEWQAPKHEIACAITGQLLDSTLKGVPEQVAQVTGMDFDRFTRSMLLAQGGFDAFLKADTDQRAPILEQITGTECYSQISMQVHEKWQLEKQALQTLQLACQHHPVLSPEAEDGLRMAIQTHHQAKTHAQTHLDHARHALAWHDTIRQLTHEADQLNHQTTQLNADQRAFASDQVVRQRAMAAQALLPAYQALQHRIAQQDDDRRALSKEKETLVTTRVEMTQWQQAVSKAEQDVALRQAEWADRDRLWQQVMALDTELVSITTSIDTQQVALRQAEAARAATQQRLTDHHHAIREWERQRDTLAQWRDAHAEDKALADEWPRLQVQMGWWQPLQQGVQRRQTEWDTAVQAVAHAKAHLADGEAQLVRCEDESKRCDQALDEAKQSQATVLGGRDMAAYREEKAQLEAAHRHAVTVANLQAQRAHLQPDSPCPLCGSTTHPWVMGHAVPEPNDDALAHVTAIMARAEEWAVTVRDCETKRQAAHQQLVEAKHHVSLAREQLTAAQRHCDTAAAELARDRQALAGWWSRNTWWQGPPPDSEAAMAEAWQHLTDRVTRWQANQTDEAYYAQQRDQCQALIQQELATETAQTNAIATLQGPLTNHQTTRQRLIAQRAALYGEQHIEDDKQRLRQAIEGASVALKQAQTKWQAYSQRVGMAEGRIDGLETQWKERAVACEAQKVEWQRAYEAAGFENESVFLSSIRPATVIEQLTQQANALAERGIILANKTKECQERLANERARAVTDASWDDTKASVEWWQREWQTHCTQWEVKAQQLAANDEARRQLDTLHHRIEAQKKECQRWDHLHALIGSADGKKYRLFAQSMTFDGLIAHANHHVSAMTDRYQLIRDETTPLALNVVDHYQGGHIRSTKNLSGGESFMVSLALALGLSHMASQNVRVDSLFLDEGFGTLDDEALHTAIDTLSSLYQGGKMMGVISHVPALKERIRTQIQVIPIANGRSRLSGPGVLAGGDRA